MISAISRTRSQAAKGLCGFSQPEILFLSDPLLEDLIDVFQTMQDQQSWPQILLAARTFCTKKLPICA